MIPQDGDPLHVDEPEGTAPLRRVRVSETLFRALGATGVLWGEPDKDGFYSPSIMTTTTPVVSRGLQRWVLLALFILGVIVGALVASWR